MTLHVHLVPSLAGAVVGSPVVVEGAEGHHAVAVRRLAVGQQLHVTDGRGTFTTCEVTATAKQRLDAVVLAVAAVPRPEPEVVVVQALPKGDRGELAVELLTEIGAARIVPWAASRSVSVWRGERAERSLAKWRATAREAAKQARRPWFPEVSPLASTADVVELVGAVAVALVLHEEGTVPLSRIEPPADGQVVVVVGPEGGISEEELAAFGDAGARVVRLGPEVLRTSTAGLAAAAALLSRSSRWG